MIIELWFKIKKVEVEKEKELDNWVDNFKIEQSTLLWWFAKKDTNLTWE